MSNPLDRDLVRKMVNGFAEANRFIDAERRARLPQMTLEEGWRWFDQLYQTWLMLGNRSGGDWQALDRARLEETIADRRPFEILARAKGLI